MFGAQAMDWDAETLAFRTGAALKWYEKGVVKRLWT